MLLVNAVGEVAILEIFWKVTSIKEASCSIKRGAVNQNQRHNFIEASSEGNSVQICSECLELLFARVQESNLESRTIHSISYPS